MIYPFPSPMFTPYCRDMFPTATLFFLPLSVSPQFLRSCIATSFTFFHIFMSPVSVSFPFDSPRPHGVRFCFRLVLCRTIRGADVRSPESRSFFSFLFEMASPIDTPEMLISPYLKILFGSPFFSMDVLPPPQSPSPCRS